jgi:hypothetical protein
LPNRSRSKRQRLTQSEREQPLLDENGHFADEIHRLAALLEDTRVPFHAIGQVVDSVLVCTVSPGISMLALTDRSSGPPGDMTTARQRRGYEPTCAAMAA